MTHKPTTLTLLALAVLLPATALACTVPVFRYALDRWPGEFFAIQTDAATAEKPFMADIAERYDLNLRVVTSDEADTKTALYSPFDPQTPVWTAKDGETLDKKTLNTLVDSPARQEIIKRILDGESAVWVVVTSGDEKADKPLLKRLNDRLKFFEEAAELPVIDPYDPSSRLGPGPDVELRLSTLTIVRDDPKEALLIKMLAGPEADLLESKDAFVSPVFGRGRVLGAWPGDDMDEAGIEEVCFYITGACSCQVKDQNPGWDLLLKVEWDRRLYEIEEAKYAEEEEADAAAEEEAAAEDGDAAPADAPDKTNPDASADSKEPETVVITPPTDADETPDATETDADDTEPAPASKTPSKTLLIAGAGVLAIAGAVLFLRKS
jgi:hypothetical protein